MSEPAPTGDGTSEGDTNPLDRQREMMQLLSQETRHDIVQALLGHPHHLASEDELDYLVHNKSTGAVQDAIGRLSQEGILGIYEHEPNKHTRDYPYKFYGFTVYGIDVLDQFNYLKGVPFARAVHEKTRKSAKTERHENAPRPDLPDEVVEALGFEGDRTTDSSKATDTVQLN
ncbi:MAG: ArsR family transcriptional regulator [Haloarculaceae archaeon]